MTVLIATVYRDGVILASDSQVEAAAGVDYKRTDAIKLYPVKLNGASVVIGEAGEVRVPDRIIEVFEQTTKEQTFRTAREVADALEEAVRVVMLKYFSGPVHPSDDSRNFTLLMGVRRGDEKAIFSVGEDALSQRDNLYAATGSGEPIAEYLLSKLHRAVDFDLEFASRVAVTVIEEVKNIDTHCGGKTQMIMIRGDDILTRTDAEIKELVKYTEGINLMTKFLWLMLGSSETKELAMKALEPKFKGENPPA